MAKGGKNKASKNVFKVAGARSLKAKNKTKVVTTQIKKLSLVTKQETEQVDKLLNQLQDTVRQKLPTRKPAATPFIERKLLNKQDKIEAFTKLEENSAQALDKLNKMEV